MDENLKVYSLELTTTQTRSDSFVFYKNARDGPFSIHGKEPYKFKSQYIRLTQDDTSKGYNQLKNTHWKYNKVLTGKKLFVRERANTNYVKRVTVDKENRYTSMDSPNKTVFSNDDFHKKFIELKQNPTPDFVLPMMDQPLKLFYTPTYSPPVTGWRKTWKKLVPPHAHRDPNGHAWNDKVSKVYDSGLTCSISVYDAYYFTLSCGKEGEEQTKSNHLYYFLVYTCPAAVYELINEADIKNLENEKLILIVENLT